MSRIRCYIAEPVTVGVDVPDQPSEHYWHERSYFHPETRAIVTWSKLPPGALVEHPYTHGRPGPDGKMWILKCPDGFPWMMNAPSQQGGFWTITGSAPDLTATPSIHVSVDRPNNWEDPSQGHTTHTLYHGFLNAGWLESTSDSPC
jgi:hypothetical protein